MVVDEWSEKTVADAHIEIRQAETTRALAFFAHLRQIMQTALSDDCRQFRRPLLMDHADLLLAAASMRALFFDDRAQPIAPSFLKDHKMPVEIEALETNVSLLLLSALIPGGVHVSDFLVDALIGPETKRGFQINQPNQGLYCFTDGKGFETIAQRPDIWVPAREDEAHVSSGLGVSNLGGPAQLLTVTRRRVPLEKWGDIRIGYLKDRPIKRRTLLTYVANKMGGVHYDSRRLPREEMDRNEYQFLSAAYDWEDQAIMSTGLVATALACIELANVRELFGLTEALAEFHVKRQLRLRKGEKLKK
jgi:hypothetical protein